MENELLTSAEVASLLRVNRTSVWEWRRSGHLPQPIDIAPAGRRRPALRWRKSDLIAFIGGSNA
jgi:predicted DNA-binding transcriptional regulator AlpA